MTTTAHAPSEICEDEPAVIVPSEANAGFSRARVSTVVSTRMPSSWEKTTGSPLRCGISTGAISSSKSPFFWAVAASWWERAEKASCSSRVREYLALARSVSDPMEMRSKESNSASRFIESASVESPYLVPVRPLASRCGA